MTKKNIAILGSTGSIGRQTLDVIESFPDLFSVASLTSYSNVQLLAEQTKKFRPRLVAIVDESKYLRLKALLEGYQVEVISGQEAAVAAATLSEVDTVLAAISGVAGLGPVWAAIKEHKEIALANKEVLVAAGEPVMKLVRENNIRLLPVDSEHSAIFQCLEQDKNALDSLILTASGGPFWQYPAEELEKVTPEMALKHPTWNMGKKITIDSATLMNKGFEVIEARWLFDVSYDNIKVVLHRESIIHSLVQYQDGSLLAHLGPHDMRIPIQYALTYPQRMANNLQKIDLSAIEELHFGKPDQERFPCLRLAYEAGKAEGTYPAVLNAANEVLVHKFLNGEISFTEIAKNIEIALSRNENVNEPDLDEIYDADLWAREFIENNLRR